MKRLTLCFILALTLCVDVHQTFAQGTAFTYQGRLNDGINPAHGTYDFRFKLFEDPFGNTQTGGAVLTNGIVMTNGLFTVSIDFGAGIFSGSNYWLEVDVRTNGTGSYANLNPLQPVTPTPYAIFANTASNLAGTISAANLSGTYGGTVSFTNNGDSFTGNGSGLTGLNASQLTSGTVPATALSNAWKTTGNAGTTAGVNFVGTTDNQPLELHVNSQRALRLTPDSSTNNSPDIIGGSPVNAVGAGLVGVTIGGGGAAVYGGLPATNLALGDFNTIAGGWGNTTGSTNFDVSEATIAGGGQNTASGISSFIGGGAFNVANGNNATVAGGLQNRANYHAFVGSGYANTADGIEAMIGGGRGNNIQTNTVNFVIGGGYGNTVQGNNFEIGATIGGGALNTIQPDAVFDGHNPFGGGFASSYSTIGGGYVNQVQSNSTYCTIPGGLRNTIQPGVSSATIGGGQLNIIESNSYYATIGGGSGNSASGWATVGGGQSNMASNIYATVSGGAVNVAAGGYSAVGGGNGNTASGSDATVSGGNGNNASANFSVVSGGNGNNASGAGAFVGGGGYDGALSEGNLALGVASVVSGGLGNVATNQYATVSGGYHNSAGGSLATISGGDQGTASGGHATVSGGFQNTASGDFATVDGGYQNTAGGIYSFAAGQNAQAVHQGAFVWADSQSGAYASDRNNQFKIRAGGGVEMDVSSSSHLSPAALYVNSTSANGVGLYVTESSTDAALVVNNSGTADIIKGFNGGGNAVFEVIHSGAVNATAFNVTSDRNAKENFQVLNPEQVLEKVASLSISEWNYKTGPADEKHIGPMAQDFHAAFGLNGSDDKHISVVDEGGVALAAIQGLNQKLNEKDAEIQQLKQSVAQLQALVSQMAKSGPDNLVGSSTLNKKSQTMERSKL